MPEDASTGIRVLSPKAIESNRARAYKRLLHRGLILKPSVALLERYGLTEWWAERCGSGEQRALDDQQVTAPPHKTVTPRDLPPKISRTP